MLKVRVAIAAAPTPRMKETARRERNQARLHEMHPAFARRVARVIAELEDEGWRPRIEDAWRSPAAQHAAWTAGHSAKRWSLHNATDADGRPAALAADVLDDDAPWAPGKPFLLRLAAAAEAAGLRSGIRRGLPARLAAAIDEAITLRDWQAPVKIGWDPLHLEVTGLTVAQARAGTRPDQEPGRQKSRPPAGVNAPAARESR